MNFFFTQQKGARQNDLFIRPLAGSCREMDMLSLFPQDPPKDVSVLIRVPSGSPLVLQKRFAGLLVILMSDTAFVSKLLASHAELPCSFGRYDEFMKSLTLFCCLCAPVRPDRLLSLCSCQTGSSSGMKSYSRTGDCLSICMARTMVLK